MTDRAVAGSDLFRRVEAHYQEHFTREGRGEAFADWLAPLRGELAEVATHGASPAFIPCWCVPDGVGSAAQQTRPRRSADSPLGRGLSWSGGSGSYERLGHHGSPSCPA